MVVVVVVVVVVVGTGVGVSGWRVGVGVGIGVGVAYLVRANSATLPTVQRRTEGEPYPNRSATKKTLPTVQRRKTKRGELALCSLLYRALKKASKT